MLEVKHIGTKCLIEVYAEDPIFCKGGQVICRGCRGKCKRWVVKISIIGYRASRLKLNYMEVRLGYIRNYITPPPYHDKVLDQAFSPSCFENSST